VTLVSHQQKFALNGSHIAVPCIGCHKPAEASGVAVYRFASLSCTSCHSDPHRGEFALRMSIASSDGKPVGCRACHSTEVWNDLTRFDHATTRFALVGAHRAVGCADCHRPPNRERTLRNVAFKSAALACEGCHEDPHGAQFAGKSESTHCQNCHDSTKWRPSLYDHEKSAFPLRGGHQNVRCASCHVNVKAVGGTPVLFYKPTPTACVACHGATVMSRLDQPAKGRRIP
jgi:hypothetical protein